MAGICFEGWHVLKIANLVGGRPGTLMGLLHNFHAGRATHPDRAIALPFRVWRPALRDSNIRPERGRFNEFSSFGSQFALAPPPPP